MGSDPPPYSQNAHFTPASTYQPPMQPEVQPATVIIQQVQPVLVGQDPLTTTCRSCNAVITTRVETTASSRTHLWALLLCLFGCWPCVCVPYCMDSCQNANHYCPNCNAYIGTYSN